MITQLQGTRIGKGGHLAVGAALCAAALAGAPALAREGSHGAANGQWHAGHAGQKVIGARSAVWHAPAVHYGHIGNYYGGYAHVGSYYRGYGHAGYYYRGYYGYRGYYSGSGRWWYGWHGNRYGWWWYGGGFWWPYYAWGFPYYPYYSYPAYPNPPDPPPNYSGLPAQPQSLYYCDSARGFYPQVPSCPSGWREVPPMAPPPEAGTPPPTPPAQ